MTLYNLLYVTIAIMSPVTKQSGHVGAGAGREQCNINNIQRCRDYTLNPDTALLKKLVAAKRQHIEYEYTDAGIKASMDAVSFELFRFSCDEFFKTADDSRVSVKIDSAKDNKGNVV